jgi:hypothetical protein
MSEIAETWGGGQDLVTTSSSKTRKKHPLMSIFQHKMWSKCFALCMGILKDEMVLPKNGKCLLSGEELLGLV